MRARPATGRHTRHVAFNFPPAVSSGRIGAGSATGGSSALTIDIEDLIDHCYEAATDPSRWQAFVDAVDRHLDGAYVQLHAHDYVSNFNSGVVVTRHSPEFQDAYTAYYSTLNPLVPKLAVAPVGRVFRTEELVDFDAIKRGEFYNDWARPQEDSAIGCGAVLFRDEQRLFIFGAQLPSRHVDDKMEKALRTIDLLIPHLQRALRLHRSFARAAGEAQRHRLSLDVVQEAVFHLDARGRIRWMNRAGEAMCAKGAVVQIDLAQRLSTGDAKTDDTIRAFCLGSRTRGLRIVIDRRLEPRSGPLLLGNLVASPILGDIWHAAQSDIRAVLTLQTSGDRQAWAAVAAHFRLTGAEARLVEGLVQGLPLDECARRNGTSIHTVRNQLRAAMDKTSTHRQAELVALLAPYCALPS